MRGIRPIGNDMEVLSRLTGGGDPSSETCEIRPFANEVTRRVGGIV